MSIANLKKNSIPADTKIGGDDFFDEPVKPEVEEDYQPDYSEQKRNGPLRVKRVGRNVKNEKKAVRFMALYKGAMILPEDQYVIQFVGHEYTTDDPWEINFIRTFPAFNQEFWEDKFPDWVIDKMKKQTEEVSRVPIEPELHKAR